MVPSNDNRPAADAGRFPPILRRLGSGGRVIPAAERPILGQGADPRFPNDPREA